MWSDAASTGALTKWGTGDFGKAKIRPGDWSLLWNDAGEVISIGLVGQAKDFRFSQDFFKQMILKSAAKWHDLNYVFKITYSGTRYGNLGIVIGIKSGWWVMALRPGVLRSLKQVEMRVALGWVQWGLWPHRAWVFIALYPAHLLIIPYWQLGEKAWPPQWRWLTSSRSSTQLVRR